MVDMAIVADRFYSTAFECSNVGHRTLDLVLQDTSCCILDIASSHDFQRQSVMNFLVNAHA